MVTIRWAYSKQSGFLILVTWFKVLRSKPDNEFVLGCLNSQLLMSFVVLVVRHLVLKAKPYTAKIFFGCSSLTSYPLRSYASLSYLVPFSLLRTSFLKPMGAQGP